ncbi:MAG: LamG-like jellyroll fold domain-containing protein [Verrucomicrobiota bacterium]
MKKCFLPALALVVLSPCLVHAAGLRAGAFAIDISPTNFPVIVNGSFVERTTDKVFDPIHARCLVLDDGTTRLATVVVDSCMVPRELLDEAKALAAKRTGIPTDRMLISSTHTHSAPSSMACLGSGVDPRYPALLKGRLVEGIAEAMARLQPARAGWAAAKAPEHTYSRRWIMRPDKMRADPFGNTTVRAMMHPGHQNPDYIGPSGPVDDELSLLAFQTRNGKPLALLANFSMHYFGAPMVSADYYGAFCERFKAAIGADKGEFVAMMSQGTSGDLQWKDYGAPAPKTTMNEYADGLVKLAQEAYRTIRYRDDISLAMAETTLTLGRRTPDAKRLAWAKDLVAKLGDRKPKTHPEIYAQEAVLLHQNPTRELKLQAVRIGDAGITAIPDEVFSLTGLKLKWHSPLQPTFNIELANGSEGYIPPPEQHQLGGYTTWPARTAGLEADAEPKIVNVVLGLLEKVSGKVRRPFAEVNGALPRLILEAQPLAYYRFGEHSGTRVNDQTENNFAGLMEPGYAWYLPGPQSPAFSLGETNRAPQFAGGRMSARVERLGGTYTVSLWFWNGLPNNARPVTGYLFSRGPNGDAQAPGDHLGIGGTHRGDLTGKLIFFNGNQANQVLAGRTEIPLKTWQHVGLVRDGRKVRVYLNGQLEIEGEAEATIPETTPQIFIGGRCDNFANFEGRIDEVAIYGRALKHADISTHARAGVDK